MLPSFETVCLVVLTAVTVSGLWALWPAETPGVISEVEAAADTEPERSEEANQPVAVAAGVPLTG